MSEITEAEDRALKVGTVVGFMKGVTVSGMFFGIVGAILAIGFGSLPASVLSALGVVFVTLGVLIDYGLDHLSEEQLQEVFDGENA